MLSRPHVQNALIILQNSSMVHEIFQQQYANDEKFKDIYTTLIQGKHVEKKDYYV